MADGASTYLKYISWWFIVSFSGVGSHVNGSTTGPFNYSTTSLRCACNGVNIVLNSLREIYSGKKEILRFTLES